MQYNKNNGNKNKLIISLKKWKYNKNLACFKSHK